MDRIAATRTSLKGFVYGLFGLVPILGLVPAIKAWLCWRQVHRHYQDWNPARKYLYWGLILSWLALIGNLMVAVGFLLTLLF